MVALRARVICEADEDSHTNCRGNQKVQIDMPLVAPKLGKFSGAKFKLSCCLRSGDSFRTGAVLADLSLPSGETAVLRSNCSGTINKWLISPGQVLKSGQLIAMLRSESGRPEGDSVEALMDQLSGSSGAEDFLHRRKRNLAIVGAVWIFGAAGCAASIIYYLAYGGALSPALGGLFMGLATYSLWLGKRSVTR